MGKKKKAKGAPEPFLDDGGDATLLTHTGKKLDQFAVDPTAALTRIQAAAQACIAALPSAKGDGIFDVYDAPEEQDPITVPHGTDVFHLEDEQLEKKELDDASTPGPPVQPRGQPVSWHDVADDDLDFGNFRFLCGAGASTSPGAFGATGVLESCFGHAASNSQEHETQCGKPRHVDADGSSPLALDGSDAVPVLPLLSMTPPDEGEAGSVCRSVAWPLGHVNTEGAVELDGAPLAAAGCFEGEPCALDDSDTLGYDISSGPQSDIQASFQEFARTMLHDVYPSSDHSEPSLDGDPCAEELSPDGGAEPLPLRGTGSPGTSPGGGQGNVGTQCGPLPHGHAFLHSPVGGTAHSLEDIKQDVDSPQTSRTQCGPLPHGHDSFHAVAAEAAHSQDDVKQDPQSPQTSRTQSGPLPLDDDHGFFPNGGSIFDYDPFDAFKVDDTPQDALADITREANQVLLAFLAAQQEYELQLERLALQHQQRVAEFFGTQCGPLPHGRLPSLPNADMTAHRLDHGKHGNATLGDQQIWSHRTETLRTQCGPLPHGHASFHSFVGETSRSLEDIKQDDDSQRTSRTQCGPLPHGHDSFHTVAGEAAHSIDDVKQDAQGPQLSRTQCGPLPLAHGAYDTPASIAAPAASFGPSQRQMAIEHSHARAKPRAHQHRRGRRK